MGDVEDIIAAQLDACRSFGLGLGESAVLIPLAVAAGRGYSALSIPVESGWTLEDSELGGDPVLLVVEKGFLDRATLLAARAFSINGRVYEIAGQYKKMAPEVGTELAQWVFPVSPTGEEFGA